MSDKNYNDSTKEELLSLVKSRGIAGVPAASAKADIIAALELDDEAVKDMDSAAATEAAPKGAKGKQMRYLADVGNHNPEPFDIYEVDGDDKPWKAKSATRFWEGTRAELLAQFDDL